MRGQVARKRVVPKDASRAKFEKELLALLKDCHSEIKQSALQTACSFCEKEAVLEERQLIEKDLLNKMVEEMQLPKIVSDSVKSAINERHIKLREEELNDKPLLERTFEKGMDSARRVTDAVVDATHAVAELAGNIAGSFRGVKKSTEAITDALKPEASVLGKDTVGDADPAEQSAEDVE